MLGKHIKRAFATAGAVGTVLAVAATTTPAVVTTSPEISNVACTRGYENPVRTFVQLNLEPGNMVQFGQRVRAVATVQGEGNPSGTVRIVVAGESRTVSKGAAAGGVTLPNLPAQETYTVRAAFRPDCADGREYAGDSDTTQLTVGRADTNVVARAGDRDRGERPTVTGVVSSTRAPGGEVRVTISNGRASKSQTVGLDRQSDGESSFRAVFGRTFKRGEWDVSVRYLGAKNYERSGDSTSFRITR